MRFIEGKIENWTFWNILSRRADSHWMPLFGVITFIILRNQKPREFRAQRSVILFQFISSSINRDFI